MQDSLSIAETQQAIIEEFTFFDDWNDKYKLLIDISKEAEPFPETFRLDSNKVKGCQSQVWLHAEDRAGKIHFYGDSDAVIVKGIMTLLLRVFSDHSPKEILESNNDFIEAIGLSTHLSPTRSNGLAAMLKQIRLYALAFSEKEKQ